MSALIDATGRIDDAFTFAEDSAALATAERPVLVPLELLSEALAGGSNAPVGVLVPNRTKAEDLVPHFGSLALIAIAFPGFSDGTGLSLARRLRREGFTGRLRARGPLVADQFAEALACGFDEVELPDASAARQPVQQWLAAKDSISAHYQTGYGEDRSILQRRLDAKRSAA